MKRTIAILLIGALLVSVPVSGWAVDKKKKEDPPKVAPKPVPTEPAKDTAKKEQSKPKQGEKKKYDNFVDANNNGIDDRLEKDQKKPDK